MDIESLDARTISQDDALGIAKLLVKVWPKKHKPLEVRLKEVFSRGQGFTGPENQAPRFFLVRKSNRIIANATLVSRVILTTEGPLTVAGLAWVCCDPDARGLGLGVVVSRAVFDLVDEGVFPFSLFQTSDVIRPFYEKLGAVLVENRVINSLADDPTETPFRDKLVMRYPADRHWPEGDIDLRGPGY